MTTFVIELTQAEAQFLADALALVGGEDGSDGPVSRRMYADRIIDTLHELGIHYRRNEDLHGGIECDERTDWSEHE